MATPVINEIDADQVSTDSFEFIELRGDPGASLDNYFLVLFNGSNDSSYRTIDLSGSSFDANGFFVIGSGNVPNVDIGLREENILQNGADAVALFLGDGTVTSAEFGNGTAVTSIPTGFTLVDSIVYDTNDSDDAGLIAALGGPQINEGGNGRQLTESIQRLPDGSDTFITAAPTPGEPNQASPAPATVTIMQIQGAGHISPYVNQDVITSGVVTAVDSNGFYLQDPDGDGDIATSDAVFVFTGSSPSVSVGDAIDIEATVTEIVSGGSDTGNLSQTQVVSQFEFFFLYGPRGPGLGALASINPIIHSIS